MTDNRLAEQIAGIAGDELGSRLRDGYDCLDAEAVNWSSAGPVARIMLADGRTAVLTVTIEKGQD